MSDGWDPLREEVRKACKNHFEIGRTAGYAEGVVETIKLLRRFNTKIDPLAMVAINKTLSDLQEKTNG